MIDLAPNVTTTDVERAYAFARQLHAKGRSNPEVRRWLVEGMNRARVRDPRLLVFLDKGANHLQKLNDEQKSRFEQEGHRTQEFSEFAMWREAYIKVMEPRRDEEVLAAVYGWIFAGISRVLAG